MKFSKHAVLEAFENPRSRYFSPINDILAIATFVSIVVIVLETVPSLEVYRNLFLIVEWATVIVFGGEYISRLWASKSRWSYACSYFGIIDLVAIVPTILGLGNLTFLKSARVIRIIRFLRVIRLAKISRLKMKDPEETFGIFGFNIMLYATTLVCVTLAFGVILHLFYTNEVQYWSIPAGMYWTFAVFLGGLPIAIPPGTSGTILFIAAKFFGMALFGLLVGIVGKLFNMLILGKGK